MTAKLLTTLMNKDITSKEHAEWQDCTSAAEMGGHATLHNMLTSAHPALAKNHVETKIPFQKRSESLVTCITGFFEWFRREEYRGRLYTHGQRLEIIISNLHNVHAKPFIIRPEQHHKSFTE